MSPEVEVRPAQWTREQSRRFWDWMASRPELEDSYFSRRVGEAILDYAVSRGVDTAGRVLDFGCGPGYLLERMAARGWRCSGLDFSRRSVETARARLDSGEAVVLAEELPSSLEPASFEAIFLLETVEHLQDEDLKATLAEVHRLLVPSGWLVVTCPNEEELARSEALCPQCGCLFHTMQHVRSWDERTLRAVVGAAGFEVESCRPLVWMERLWMTRLMTGAYRLVGRKPRNLVLAARRPKGNEPGGKS